MKIINSKVCVSICACACVRVCVYVCVYIRLYVYVCICMYVYMCMDVNLLVCGCMYVHVFAYGCIIYSQLVCSVHTRHTTYGSAACGTDSAGQEQQMIQPGGVTEREDR